MKNLTKAAIIFALLTTGCTEHKPSGNVITVSTNEVSVTGSEDHLSSNVRIYHYVIDGCEYYGYLKGDYRGRFLTHSGTCKNEIHKYKQK